MNHMFLKSITLENFKGLKSFEALFLKENTVVGDNGTGKSTLTDAQTWLLFGVDTLGRKDYQIKTLDANNKPIHKLEHSVTGVYIDSVTGEEVKLKRLYREIWTKPRGQEEAIMSGHETLYYWNDVPLDTMAKYKAKVDSIIQEDLFRLITNPLYFASLKWDVRRQKLTDMAGEVTDEEIIAINPDFKKLLSGLGSKTLDEYKKEVSAKRKRLNDDLKLIPSKVSATRNMMPVQRDFVAIEEELSRKKEELSSIDAQLEDCTRQDDAIRKASEARQSEAANLRSKIFAIENEARNEFLNRSAEKKNKIDAASCKISANIGLIASDEESILSYEKSIESKNLRLEELRTEWESVDSECLSLSDDDLNCPTCGQLLPVDKLEEKKEEISSNFNRSKARRLKECEENANQIKKDILYKQTQIDGIRAEMQSLSETNTKLQQEIEQIQGQSISAKPVESILAENKSYLELKSQYEELIKPIEVKPLSDNTLFKQSKASVADRISVLTTQLADKVIIERGEKTVTELEAQEKELSQQIAQLEGTEFLIESYNTTLMDVVESRINRYFEVVKFKMFRQQVNGGSEPCCDILIDGVPFEAANTASKINAGLDIINAFCKHYDISAPIFIDNRECVTRIIPCVSQVINLFKDEKYKQLTML